MFVVSTDYGFAIAATKLLAIAECPDLGAGMQYTLHQTDDENAYLDGSGCLCSESPIVNLGEHTLSRAEETAAIAAFDAFNPDGFAPHPANVGNRR